MINDMKSINRKDMIIQRSFSSADNTRPLRLFGKGTGSLNKLDDSVIPEIEEKGIFKIFFNPLFLN